MSNNETIANQTLSDLELFAVREQLNNDLFSQVSLPRHVVAGMLTLIDELHTLQANHDSDADRELASIMYLCTQTDGTRGIWKRIDENRELLECIQKYAPEFLERCGWICNWIGCQDAFLLTLKKLLSLPNSPFPAPGPFPRSWPDCGDFDSMGLSEDWVETCCKKVGRSDSEQSKGKQ